MCPLFAAAKGCDLRLCSICLILIVIQDLVLELVDGGDLLDYIIDKNGISTLPSSH